MPEKIETTVRDVIGKNEDGESRQEIIDQSLWEMSSLELKREPDNVNDPNAIAVYLDYEEKKIGYLSKNLSERYANRMDTNQVVLQVSKVKKITKPDDSLGLEITLDVYSPEEYKIHTDQIKMNLELEEKKQLRKKYGLKWWRIILAGLFLLSIFAGASALRGEGFLVSLIVILIFLSIIALLLLPWLRWLVDQIRKASKSRNKS